jgi:hypothetical protein
MSGFMKLYAYCVPGTPMYRLFGEQGELLKKAKS